MAVVVMMMMMIMMMMILRMGEKRNAYRILVGKPGGKRPLRRPRRRWVDNIVACFPCAGTVEARSIETGMQQ
jgi:ABC-type Fe3+ transport system permease subunit